MTSLITKKSSNKAKLQELAETIYKISQKNAMKFKISWVARNQNSTTEKEIENNRLWRLATTQSFYKYLSKILGQFAIDRFAHCDDIKCKKV